MRILGPAKIDRTPEEYLAARDKTLGKVIRAVGPCRLRRTLRGFEAVVEIIVSQQLSVKVADAIFARLRAAAGGRLTPISVHKLTERQLRKAGLSRAKVISLRDLVERVESGDVSFRKITRLPDAEVIEMLTRVKGIGRWSAQMYLLFVLGRPDVFSAGDKGLQTAIARLYGVHAHEQDLDGFADRWKPYRSTACWYLWRSLSMKPFELG